MQLAIKSEKIVHKCEKEKSLYVCCMVMSRVVYEYVSDSVYPCYHTLSTCDRVGSVVQISLMPSLYKSSRRCGTLRRCSTVALCHC